VAVDEAIRYDHMLDELAKAVHLLAARDRRTPTAIRAALTLP